MMGIMVVILSESFPTFVIRWLPFLASGMLFEFLDVGFYIM